ncbi:MAG: hypothetical protein GX442_21725 [Candidatus Riflebacteria bacterium]|nr:hypothetical protein [Candidatus Riflebacteria bacterium]
MSDAALRRNITELVQELLHNLQAQLPALIELWKSENQGGGGRLKT